MLATERLLEIEEAYGEKVQSIVPLELDGETLSQTRWVERKPAAIVRNLPGRGDGGHTPWTLNALSTSLPACWR